jgi:PTH1 family peptidyl-tRNA hydrolase
MERFLLIGLGNPGKQYAGTRHNLGIQTLRYWTSYVSKQNPGALIKDWTPTTKFNSEIASLKLSDKHITCMFPHTHMNKSGQAVSQFLHKRWSRMWSTIDT